MNPWAGAAAGVVIGCYATVSHRLSTTPVSGPLVFVATGLAIGPLGLGLTDWSREAESVRVLLESALALLLFTGASSIRARELRREQFLPVRLLTIGLPLTMGLGWLVAWLLLPGLSVWELAQVGIILAPTDAALGQQAVSDKRVPALTRHGLSVESGLNDGVALPFFVLALAAAGGHGFHQSPLETFLRALLLSGVIGFAAGWLGARTMSRSTARGWSTPEWQQLLVLAVPITAYEVSAAVRGSGFIAAWIAGLAFGSCLRTQVDAQGTTKGTTKGTDPGTEFADRLGGLLAALSFLAFGALILGPALEHVTWPMLAYALLSLTVIRMLPVALALLGSGLRPPTVAYVGWFGPRGLASLVFGLIAFEQVLPGIGLLSGTVALTVGLSVCLHGATAPLLGARYGAWYARALLRFPDLTEATPAFPQGADRG